MPLRHGSTGNMPWAFRLEHVLLATATNLIRLDAWWTGTPLGTTRTSHYTRLELAA
jgi:hypothetical protein